MHIHSTCENMNSLMHSKMASSYIILLMLEHDTGRIVMYYMSYTAHQSMWEMFYAQ